MVVSIYSEQFLRKNVYVKQFQKTTREVTLASNKTRTSKVGAISKAQKAQNNFLKKNLKFLKKFFLSKKSHSAEKCKRGALLDLLTYIPLQNIKNLEGGTLWEN